MRGLIFVLILAASFVFPLVRNAVRNVSVQGSTPRPKADEAESPRYLMAQLNRLMALADNPELSDQQRAVLDSQIERLNQALNEAFEAEEREADQRLAERGDAGESMLDEVEFDQAHAQMDASLADPGAYAPDEDWLLVDSDEDSIQLERLAGTMSQGARPQTSPHRLGRLNRRMLKEAVIYSEILAPKYRTRQH